jgi:hypothetical protein
MGGIPQFLLNQCMGLILSSAFYQSNDSAFPSMSHFAPTTDPTPYDARQPDLGSRGNDHNIRLRRAFGDIACLVSIGELLEGTPFNLKFQIRTEARHHAIADLHRPLLSSCIVEYSHDPASDHRPEHCHCRIHGIHN